MIDKDIELLTQTTIDSPGLFPSLNETFFVVNYETLTVESIECEEYSPILFRRKGSRSYEATKSQSQQIVRSLKAGEAKIIAFLEQKVAESWDTYMIWKRKLTEHTRHPYPTNEQ